MNRSDGLYCDICEHMIPVTLGASAMFGFEALTNMNMRG